MSAGARPRRSTLYMPGSNARALDKARGLDADVLLFDLEDSVAPAAKQTARGLVVAALREGGYGHRKLIVRVNGAETEWGEDDIRAIAGAGADGILLPKVSDAKWCALPCAAWCMMETPGAMLRAAEIAGEIAAASPRLGALVMGTTDLTQALGGRATPDRLAVLPSLGLCLLAARAHGLAALDGVHMDLSDDAGLKAACQQGRDLGFDGKTLIHPKTLAAANQIFAPAAADLEWARCVIEAHKDAEAKGAGVTLLDGKLIESLHVTEAERLLALAAAIAERGKGVA